MASHERRDRKKRSPKSTAPKSLFISFRFKAGTSEEEADRAAGFIASAIDDAMNVYRARHGRGMFEGEGGPIVAAEATVTTLH